MKKLTSIQIRQMWLDFFKSKDHQVLPGASLVPVNDKTLLWINSGVAALKQYFDGSKIPTNRRITNVQKSLRTNDIENVGKTSRHHTFFEMLGNFSIGDYFRDEAMTWAIELLTDQKYFGFDLDNLYFTYHPTDIETYQKWLKLGVKKDHLVAVEGNFWEIGEGPCGPNTEIFYDRGQKYDPSNLGTKLLADDIDNDRYLEIWNIVFSQYNAISGVKRSDYKELPSKNIDTGAGLERIASIFQEAETNFETDLFLPIIKATQKVVGKNYEDNKMAFRVIADHIRTCVFALSDGASFSNEGRGYVLRRILRRAMRFAKQIGISEPFLYKLVETVSQMFVEFYPYLLEHKLQVSKIIKSEEERFIKTLVSGEALLRKIIDEGVNIIDGQTAFKLYDTFGFPLDLTIEIALEDNLKVDIDGFNKLLLEQKQRARASRTNISSMGQQSADLLKETVKSTFIYDKFSVKAKVVALFKDGNKVNKITDEGIIITDKTVFYVESGGQVSDKGIISGKNLKAEVLNMSKAPNGQHLHYVELQFGSISVGDTLDLQVDKNLRLLTMRNHSATHLLQWALNKVLGDGLAQAGSFNNPEYLRFDFNYDGKISEGQLQQIEELVNHKISEAHAITTHVLPIKEAAKLGAKSLFSEKYDDIVRVVDIGGFSLEFCGGTHVSNSADIGLFVITSEHSVASGIRRIEALTSIEAINFFKKQQNILGKTKEVLKASTINDISTTLNNKINENNNLLHELNSLKAKQSQQTALNLINEFIDFKDLKLLVKYLPSQNRENITLLIDNLKTKYDNSLIVLIGGENEHISIVASVGKTAVASKVHAGQIIKAVTTSLNGSGGGRPDFASGGAKTFTSIEEVTKLIKDLL